MVQWHHKAQEPSGDQRSDLWFMYHLGHRIRARLDAARGTRPSRARPHLGLPDRRRARRAERQGGPGRDQRLERRRRAALRLHGAQRRRLDLMRLLDLLRRLRRRRQPDRPPQAGQRAELDRRRVGVGLAGEPPHPLQPRVRGPRRPSLERAQGAGLVGRRTGQVDGARRARLRGRQATGVPPAGGRNRPGGDCGRRSVHHAGRWPRLALRAVRGGRRPAADALRAAGLAGP